MPQHRVHGMNQVQPRIDQRAIKIKNQQADAMRIKVAQETNHGQFRINQCRSQVSESLQERLPVELEAARKIFLRPKT